MLSLLLLLLLCSVSDCIDFVLENFAESNRLWVRMHSSGAVKDKKKKEAQRKGDSPRTHSSYIHTKIDLQQHVICSGI
jgi:Vacuolar protein sorting-associated protein 35